MRTVAGTALFAVLVSIATLVLVRTPEAHACGGFACNQATLTPIIQTGERVLYIRNKLHTTMHVEVSYQGEPTSFGWLLPVPTRPMLPDGTPAPLDQIVRVSSQAIFDRLTEATAPKFGLDRRVSSGARDCYAARNAASAGDAVCNWHPGDFGATCANQSDCFSGYCVNHPDGKRSCSRTCDTICPFGYDCLPAPGQAPDAGSSPGAISLCMPKGEAEPQDCTVVVGGGGGDGPFAPQLSPSFSEVSVIGTADVGPYNAELISATSASQLGAWLAFNGYYQDPAAMPIIEAYVGLGYLFVGIKLQTNKSAGDMMPLALTFGENAPCLPLRLTAVAATSAMPIDVWVLGEGRAIPKNFLHGVINERAVSYPYGEGYPEAVAAAVNSVGGRAWVTEFADTASRQQGVLLPYPATTKSALAATTDLFELITVAGQYKVANEDDLVRLAREHMPKPSHLRGYPGGKCPSSQSCTESNANHVTTDDEYYGSLAWWAIQAHNGVVSLGGSFEEMRASVITDLVEPLLEVESYFTDAYVLTRLFTRISPEAMLRDPLFAFNADLPMVPRDRIAHGDIVVDGGCAESVAFTYPSGAKGPTVACGSQGCDSYFELPADLTADPLEALQVLDEAGGPLTIDPSEAAGYDEFLDSAVPGIPTIGDGAITNPAVQSSRSTGPTGCEGASGWATIWAAMLLLAALAVSRRRARAAL
jgi:hypothetical protein